MLGFQCILIDICRTYRGYVFSSFISSCCSLPWSSGGVLYKSKIENVF